MFLFERTATRNDMFLSRDVTMTAELVHALAPVLVRSARTDDWSAERFAAVARFQEELAALNDRFLVAARTATRDFMLWNAFARVWLLWSILGALSLKTARNTCLRTADWARVSRFDVGAYWFALPVGMPELLDDVFDLIESVELDRTLPRTAAEHIFRRLAAAQKRSETDIVREAVAGYVQSARPLPIGIGKYHSGQTDGSERARDLLREAAKDGQWP